MAQGFERKKWSTDDPAAQSWVDNLVWQVLAGPQSPPPQVSPANDDLKHAYKLCREVLIHHGLQGLAIAVFGDQLRSLLSSEFYERVEADRRRTDILLQEVSWLYGPQIGSMAIPIKAAAMRPFYNRIGKDTANPRFLSWMTLWTPTLDTRDHVRDILLGVGYEPYGSGTEMYHFKKVTMGIGHAVELKATLWEKTKNWSLDVERAMWDRAASSAESGRLTLDKTDLFLMSCRHYSVDSLLGSAINLLDMVTILEEMGVGLDWVRIQEIKNMFAKPDWLWAGLMAVRMFENRTGRKVWMPEWACSALNTLTEGFWPTFIDSRMNWSNPDTRLSEFPRASMKVTVGS